MGAGTGRIVERKHPGFQFRQADAAVFAGIVLGKAQFLLGGGQFDDNQATGMGTGSFDGVGQAAAQTFFQHQTVHHQLNVVLLVLFALDFFRQVIEDAVHPDTGKAALPGVLEDLGMFTLLAPNHRRQDDETGALTQSFHLVHNLVNSLAGNFLAALGAMGRTHSGPKEAEIVIDFRHRTDGRAGVLGSGLLVNRNGRRQALNGIHIGLVHLAQELPGVGRKTLHIPPLPFRINGIKGQAGLTGTGQAREHHQLISGDGHIHILQIILSCASNYNLVIHTIHLHFSDFSYPILYHISESATSGKCKQNFVY